MARFVTFSAEPGRVAGGRAAHVATAVVELNDRLERGVPAVVEVGARQLDVSERRHLERSVNGVARTVLDSLTPVDDLKRARVEAEEELVGCHQSEE